MDNDTHDADDPALTNQEQANFVLILGLLSGLELRS